jgi:cold-inducible RNA-binding protein
MKNLKKLALSSEWSTRIRAFATVPKPPRSKLLLALLVQRGRRIAFMAYKLYVGNLSFSTSSEELRELFAQAGNVESATVVEDRDTGRSRGFGFVEMASKEDGEKAIEQFNGTEMNGRSLTVNEARPREDRGNRGGGGRGYGGNRGGGGGGRESRW